MISIENKHVLEEKVTKLNEEMKLVNEKKGRCSWLKLSVVMEYLPKIH